MQLEKQEWLPGSGWSVAVSPQEKVLPSVFLRYQKECSLLMVEGKKLFSLGKLPAFAGTTAPLAFRGGTGGNFAIRNRESPEKFIVTTRGAHKGKLNEKNFVEVLDIDWELQKIYIRRDDNSSLPSTDSLLVAMVFETQPQINAWIHFHGIVNTSHVIHLPYPSFNEGDRKKLSSLIESGTCAINMIDHDILKTPDGTADAAIILGENSSDAFARAHALIEGFAQ